MSNLLVEIGNTALKAAWSERMTLGKTFRYQGEKFMDFILSLTRREKPEVLLLSSVYAISEADAAVLREECTYLLILDSSNKEFLVAHGLPSYLSYDRAASILAARYLFKGRGCTIVDFGTTLSVDFTGEDGMYRGGNISHFPGLPHAFQGAQPVFPVSPAGGYAPESGGCGSFGNGFHRQRRGFRHCF